MNECKLKTLEDILRVVNAENIDCFLKDFSGWLAFTIGPDAIREAVADVTEIDQEARGTMTWIDDGKNDIHINIQTRRER